jgi:hypothetical protein
MPSRIVRLTACLVPALVLGACQPPPSPPSPLILTVDSAAYHRRGQSPVSVSFSITNSGQAPLSVAQCDGSPAAQIDRWVRGGWLFAQGGYCNGGPPPPLELLPGHSLQGAVTIYEGGAYRLRVSAVTDSGRTGEGGAFSKEFDVY